MPHPAVSVSPARLQHDLQLRDLTDPDAGPHCLQLLVDAAERALAERWSCARRRHHAPRVVSVRDNYDLLGYPPDGAARAARHTRYLPDGRLLRTQMSAAIPGALRQLAAEGQLTGDVLISCPGVVYRRDCVDRLHVGEPHQLDLWRISRRPVSRADLDDMVACVLGALVGDRRWRARPAEHPYTLDGLELEVQAADGSWIEVGECGLAHPAVLGGCGIPGGHGLAMGLGLDRLAMIAKGIDDIRLLRSDDPRAARQLLDLAPWQALSAQPPARRDVSVACAAGTDDELLGDRVREALGQQAAWVEEIRVLSRTPARELPPGARKRLAIDADQENLLVCVLLRHPSRALPKAEANVMRDVIYRALHEGASG